MFFLAKYATAVDVYFTMVKRAVVDLAVSADWTPVAGDVKVSIDGGADANVTNLPVAVTSTTGLWRITLTTGELTGRIVAIRVIDQGTKTVEDQAFFLQTYGNANASIIRDLSANEQQADVAKWLGTAVATPDTVGFPKVTVKSGTGTGEVSLASGQVTAGTVGDKTGYALSTAGVLAIWHQATSAIVTAATIGKKLVDWALGTDNRVLLSADAHTSGVLFASVPTLKKNTAFNNFTIPMFDTNGNLVTGISVSGQRSLDGAAFGSLANAVTEVAGGLYKVNLATTDANADWIVFRFSGTGARDLVFSIKTAP